MSQFCRVWKNSLIQLMAMLRKVICFLYFMATELQGAADGPKKVSGDYAGNKYSKKLRYMRQVLLSLCISFCLGLILSFAIWSCAVCIAKKIIKTNFLLFVS